VVAQRGFNRTAVLVHVLAIAAGLVVGWFVMDRITPDLPSAKPPGVVCAGPHAQHLASARCRPLPPGT
jgi:hypothetical protein